MLAPQALLAAACVVFGLAPRWPLRFVHQALASLVPGAGIPNLAALLGRGPGLRIGVGEQSLAAWAPLAVVAGLSLLAVLAGLLQRAGEAEVRRVPVWHGGEEHAPELVRYPASSFYRPLKQAFQGIYPTLALRPPPFPRWLRRVFDADAWLYRPAGRLVERGAASLSRTHVGIPQVYLLWILAGTAAVVGILLSVMR
jgi:hypothetical protein